MPYPASTPYPSGRRAAVVYGSILAAGALALVIVIASATLDWQSGHLLALAAAGGIAGITAAAVAVLFYLQQRVNRASDRELQGMHARVSGIIGSAMDAIVTVDANQRVVVFNAAAEKMFGWPGGAVIGEPLSMLIPKRSREAHSGHIERFAATGVTSRRMGAQTVLLGLRADGVEFPIEASISQHAEQGAKLYTVILRDVTERVRADTALRRSREELRNLGAVSHSAREQEKSRIARELHDDLAQSLTSLKMDLKLLQETTTDARPEVTAATSDMMEAIDAMVTSTRRISADLRPLLLDDLGLVAAAEWLVQNFKQRTGVECELSVDPPDLDLQEPHATAIFRILQESLSNIARHANATLVSVTIDGAGSEIVLRVRDNGRGFMQDATRKPNSYGLVGLKERAYLVDGHIQIDTAPGEGTVIEVSIPIPAATS